MPLPVDRFTVWLNGTDDAPTEHDVVVTHQDKLKAEHQLAVMDVPLRGHPLTLTTAWVWASLRRTEAYTGPFNRFRDIDCAAVIEPQDDPEEAELVDPTQLAAATPLPSDSQPPTPSPGSTGSAAPTTD